MGRHYRWFASYSGGHSAWFLSQSDSLGSWSNVCSGDERIRVLSSVSADSFSGAVLGSRGVRPASAGSFRILWRRDDLDNIRGPVLNPQPDSNPRHALSIQESPPNHRKRYLLRSTDMPSQSQSLQSSGQKGHDAPNPSTPTSWPSSRYRGRCGSLVTCKVYRSDPHMGPLHPTSQA